VRLGLFLVIFVVLLVVVSWLLPFPGNFPVLGPPTHSPDSVVRCFALAYGPGAPTSELPGQVVLRPDASGLQGSHGPAFQATGTFDLEAMRTFSREMFWEPAGDDSIDIMWSRSPILRLPVHGDTLRGRGGHGVYPNIFLGLLGKEFAVTAVRVPCALSE